jgi:hypothetical protein
MRLLTLMTIADSRLLLGLTVGDSARGLNRSGLPLVNSDCRTRGRSTPPNPNHCCPLDLLAGHLKLRQTRQFEGRGRRAERVLLSPDRLPHKNPWIPSTSGISASSRTSTTENPPWKPSLELQPRLAERWMRCGGKAWRPQPLSVGFGSISGCECLAAC